MRKLGNDHFIHVLGKNGEPQVDKKVLITAFHKDFKADKQSVMLTTDKQGVVGLGQLKNITRIIAEFKNSSCSFSETWMIVNSELDSWTQPTDIHIIEGETIEIPTNFDDSKPLLPSEASLAMYSGDNVLTNMFKRIKLTKVPCGKYHMLTLEGLEAGTYKLCTKMCANEF